MTFIKRQSVAFNILNNVGEDSTAEYLQKGQVGMVGEVREWQGKKYKKQANGKWLEVSEYGMTKKEHSDYEQKQMRTSKTLANKVISGEVEEVGTDTSLEEMNKRISELNKISPVLYSSNIESLSANTKIFRDIANEIAKPLRRNDSTLAYLPTQFITEFIKSNGYAGVAYTSTMGTEGINVAVFDESLFKCVAVHTVEINNISYAYGEIE